MFSLFSKLLLLSIVNTILNGCLGEATCPADVKKEWSYNSNLPNGPKHWGEKYPLCNGKTQSPIDIKLLFVKLQLSSALSLIGYDKPITKFYLENTGYTVTIYPKDGVSRAIQVNNNNYTLDSFHFHWGSNYYQGAEHAINGVTGSIELHLVHKDKSGNLAVLGILSDISFLDIKNKGLTAIVNNLSKVKYAKDKSKTIDGTNNKKNSIDLSYLVPSYSPYFIYNGSLTTPPCSTNVTWVVLNLKSYLSEDQIEQFRKLSSVTKEDGGDDPRCNLVNNFRPIQARNNRKVLYYLSKNK